MTNEPTTTSEGSVDSPKPAAFRPVIFVLLLALIAALAWISVQLVQLALPTTVDKLASLAERVNDSQQTILDFGSDTVEPLAIDTKSAFTAAGATTTLSWKKQEDVGTYLFSYRCTDGVSVSTMLDGPLTKADCDTEYNLGNNNTVDVVINSIEDRYADLSYSISFVPERGQTERARGEHLITVVNNDISNLFADSSAIKPEPAITETAASDSSTPAPAVAGIETSAPAYTPVENVVTVLPTSDVNGYTDLATRLIATGNIVGDTFFPQEIIKDHRGAVQFEVKNVGSKTSEVWTYSLTLPSGGTYTSPNQAALKPNERALITVGFPTPAITDYSFTVAIDTTQDSTNLNNHFTGEVAFVN